MQSASRRAKIGSLNARDARHGLYRWSQGTSVEQRLLSPWPIRRSLGWLEHVNEPETEAELAALRRSVLRGSPYGDEAWSDTAIETLGLEMTMRPRGEGVECLLEIHGRCPLPHPPLLPSIRFARNRLQIPQHNRIIAAYNPWQIQNRLLNIRCEQ